MYGLLGIPRNFSRYNWLKSVFAGDFMPERWKNHLYLGNNLNHLNEHNPDESVELRSFRSAI